MVHSRQLNQVSTKPGELQELCVGVPNPSISQSWSMRNVRHGFVTIVATVSTFAALAIAHGQPTPRDNAAERNRRWLVDIDYLASELPRRHFNLFHNMERSALDGQLASVRAEVGTLSDGDLTTRLIQIVAGVGDGHTNVDFAARFRAVPVQLGWYPEGLAITHATPDYAWLVGGRVTRIDGLPADSVYTLTSTLVSREPGAAEKVRLMAPFIMQFPALLHGLAIGPADSLAIDLQTPDGRAHHVTLTAELTRQDWLSMWASSARHGGFFADVDPGVNYWSRIFPKDRALYIRYSFCADGRPSFADFTRRVLAAIDSAGLIRVVIDIRGNAGGNSEIIQPLIRGLSARPTMHEHSAVVVLLDRGTYSSAILNATQLRLELGATFVGEAPGAAPWHYGEVEALSLPNSELRIFYPTKMEGIGPHDTALIRPDVEVVPTLDDFLSVRDAILAAALRIAAPRH
jgi:hypothetical protein